MGKYFMHPCEENKLLQGVKDKVSQCDRCGACLPVCPLFGVRDLELASARGKNTLGRALAEGIIEPTREALKAVDFCLLCRACVDNCPVQVKTDEAMVDLRRLLIEKTGATNSKYRLVGGLLKSPRLVGIAARALSFLRQTGLNNLVPFGLAPDEYTRAHFLASFAGPAVLGPPAPSIVTEIGSGAKIAYFQGCGMKMMFPQATAESLAILQTTANVWRPNNFCCGLPHLAHGLREEFLNLARKNIRLFEKADLIISDCASCGGTLKHLASFFQGDPLWEEQAASFSRKVMDLTEYLTVIGYTPRKRVDGALTYHDPCHLARGQGIKKQPRDLLKMTGNFIEMEEAGVCCGGAGSFHLDYPDISALILGKKLKNIEKTGASLVVTGCPGCLIQLAKAARASGGKFQALHISQAI